MVKKSFYSLLPLFVVLTSFALAQENVQNTTPARIILNLTAAPATSMAVTWRTQTEVVSPQIQFAVAGDWINFTEGAKTIPAKMERVATNLLEPIEKGVCYYSGVMENLEPNTMYAYRVGAGNQWSEWSQFTTAENKVAPFDFVYMSDPQGDAKQYVSRIFREAFRKAPQARFWLFGGDLADDPEDNELGNLYDAAGFIFGMVPSLWVPGNHDLRYKVEDGKFIFTKKGWKEKTKAVSQFWRGQFTLPQNGIEGLEESCYYVDYQGVRLILMNSNERLAEQAKWMEDVLSKNPNPWTIVCFHHPLYSLGAKRDAFEPRNTFLPILDKYQVDLALTGHDHAYSRSFPLKNGEKVKENEKGTVYVISVCGPKAYAINPQYAHLMAKVAGNVQTFQVISVDGNKLSYKAYTPTGKLYDSFEIAK